MSWPITDNFNRADNDVPGTMSDGVHSWTELSVDYDIVTNQMKSTVAGSVDQVAKVTESHTETDYYVQADIIWDSTGDPGVAARITDVNNLYFWRRAGYGSSAYQLYKRVAGGHTLLNQVTGPTVNATIKIEVSGVNPTTIKCYIDTVENVSTTDSDLDSGVPGLRAYEVSYWDNFYADVLGGAPPPPVAPPTLGLMGVGK